MQQQLNISQAQIVKVVANDYDQCPLTLTYTDLTNPLAPVAINIGTYSFSFDLKTPGSDTVMKNYSLEAGAGENAYLAVTGDSSNILNMQGMWQDILENEIDFNGNYRLIQKVTDNDGNIFVHIVYLIYAQRY